MVKYTCDICGREMEADDEENLLQRAKHHLKNDHNLNRESDVTNPNIAYRDEELKQRFER